MKRPRAFAPLALLLLQLLLGLAAPIADARGEAPPSDAVVHVESDDRPSCPTGHNHLQCQFCRHVGSNLLPSGGILRVQQPAGTIVSAGPASEPAPVCGQRGCPLGSRAPPLI